MAVLMSLAGNSAGDGFLVAPQGTTYDALLELSTDGGNLSVTLQASPNVAGLVFSQVNVNLSTTPTTVMVHATLQSTSRGDTVIQVLDGMTVVASFPVTCIKHPQVNFKGRFEARFATDGAFYNRNPMYTAVLDNVVPPGWTWGLEGEPDFVPAIGNVPENLETPVGRVIRLNNPVALRSHAAPVVSTVESISGDTALGTETFLAGDPLIGEAVDFGPDTYFAGNDPRNPADADPEEYWSAAREPLALFELHFGTYFSGASKVGPFVAKATMQNQVTRSPDSRPIADGLVGAAAELAEFGLPDLQTFSETRIDLLVAHYDALPAGDSPQRRNLARRIGHLLSRVSVAKRNAVQNSHPGEFTVRTGTLTVGWSNKEVYGGKNDSAGVSDGKVDENLVFNPGDSSVVAYMSEFLSFNFEWHPFAFHSDELCGHHKGSLTHLNFDGTYSGDPHTRTVDGTRYDFQAVGEFTLLRDGSRFEVQGRHTPVAAQNPITDSHTGLTTCVSLITAVAARVGKHRISLQPGFEGRRLQFFLDGKPARLSSQGIDLDGDRVSAFDANGDTGMRVDFADGTVLTVTPAFWNKHKVWYMNVGVSNTRADEGIMGFIPRDSWLPRLSNGQSVGAMPSSPHDRYVTLYKQFADSWRVTDSTSLFVYAPGTSTATFTDANWPAEKAPCKVKPGLLPPGVQPLEGMPVHQARMVCKAVTEDDLHHNCVFDVATTGDEFFAKGYLFAQELRLCGTSVKLTVGELSGRPDRTPDDIAVPPARFAVATVAPLSAGRPVPTGCLTFYVDDVPMNQPVELDSRGRARAKLRELSPGTHRIRAFYSGGGEYGYHASSSPSVLVEVSDPVVKPDKPLDVRVVLETIEICDHDCLGKGAVWFETAVRSSHGGGQEMKARLPAHGHYTVSHRPGCNVLTLDCEIFRGKVAGDLAIEVRREGKKDFRVYKRAFEGDASSWLGQYRPDDEPADAEHVGTWRLTYRIESV